MEVGRDQVETPRLNVALEGLECVLVPATLAVLRRATDDLDVEEGTVPHVEGNHVQTAMAVAALDGAACVLVPVALPVLSGACHK